MSAPLRPPVPVGTATEVENRTGPVLTDSAFDQGTRWLLGERLDDLYEERCARTPDDLDVLRHGGMGELFGGIRAPSTLGSFLRGLHWGNVRQLEVVSRRLLAELAATTPVLGRAGAGPSGHRLHPAAGLRRPCWPNSWVGPACRDRAVRPRAP